jgi:hypothetical protein
MAVAGYFEDSLTLRTLALGPLGLLLLFEPAGESEMAGGAFYDAPWLEHVG